MVVACVAVLGKANNPLFLQTYNTQVEELKFHFIVHASLDIVEERLKEASNLQCYLGLLYPIEDYKVYVSLSRLPLSRSRLTIARHGRYGYITHTGIKFAVVVDDIEVKDQDVRQVRSSFVAPAATAAGLVVADRCLTCRAVLREGARVVRCDDQQPVLPAGDAGRDQALRARHLASRDRGASGVDWRPRRIRV